MAYIPFADAMTYYLAGPLYVAAFAVIWLGERLDRRRIATILVGFIGVLIVLRPSSATLTPPALIALAGSIFFALLMITTRKLRETRDTTSCSARPSAHSFRLRAGALFVGAPDAPRFRGALASSGSWPWRRMSASTDP